MSKSKILHFSCSSTVAASNAVIGVYASNFVAVVDAVVSFVDFVTVNLLML